MRTDPRPAPAVEAESGAIDRIVSPAAAGRQPHEVLFRRWRAPAPRAALLFLHGLGGHTDRYQNCGRTWAARGISTYALELQGFGRTDGPKGHVDTFDVYQRDLEVLLAHAMAEHSKRPVFLLGESMGGVVAVDFAIQRPALLSGLVLVSPSFQDRLNVPLKTKLEAGLHVLLRHRKYYDLPWNPQDFTRDAALIDFLNHDENEVRRVTAQFYFAYMPIAARARKGARFLKLPVLMVLPGEDRMIDSDYSRDYFERIASPDKRLAEYPGHFHAILLDLGKEKVLGDIADWILERS